MLQPLSFSIANTLSDVTESRNLPALQPRDQPLTAPEAERLERSIHATFQIKPTYRAIYGGAYGVEYEPTGHELAVIDRENALQVVQELTRPSRGKTIAYHLSRLASHLRDTRGEAIAIVIQDLAQDMIYKGICEIAVMRACKYFRYEHDSHWFPESRKIMDRCLEEQFLIDKMAKLLTITTGA